MSKLICCRCKKEKEEEDFSFKNKGKNIRNKTCKECFKGIRKRWYNKYKKNIIDKNLRNKQKNIEWFEEYKKNLKCIKCPENHISCLEFHHLDSNNKEFNISQLAHSTYSIETILKEIDKCIVLCSNCHRKLHYEEKTHP
jgi:hypothetical protein